MEAPKHLTKSMQILWKMEYDWEIQFGATEEEAMTKANKKVQRTEDLCEQERNEDWVDITTGKKVQYGGW